MRLRSAALLSCLALSALAACNATPSTDTTDAAAPMPAEAADASSATDAPSSVTAPAPQSNDTDGASDQGSPDQESTAMTGYRAFGNEPFWSARVSGDTLVFSTPEDQDGRSMQGERVPSLRGFTFVGTDDGMEFNLDIQKGECSDGMSDATHEYTSTFMYRGTTYRGCAEAL